MSAPLPPGQAHPAYADHAERVREYGRGGKVVELPFASGGPEPEDCTVTLMVLIPRRVAQTLDRRYGWYEWIVWEDQLGRMVAEDEAHWVVSAEATIHPPYNPVIGTKEYKHGACSRRADPAARQA